jgi:hypothetical protein
LHRSAEDVRHTSLDQAHQLSDHFKPLVADTVERVQPVLKSARARVEPAYVATKERVGPAVSATRERVGPAVAATRERVGPAVDSAKDRLNEDVIPRLAGALAVAAETMSERAADVHDRAYEVSVRPARRRRRKRILLVVAVGAGVAAGVAVLLKRNRSQNWEKFEAQAEDWARETRGEATEAAEAAKDQFPATADRVTGTQDEQGLDIPADTQADDSSGASLDEALADATEAPSTPTTPDAPVEEHPVAKPTRKRAAKTETS